MQVDKVWSVRDLIAAIKDGRHPGDAVLSLPDQRTMDLVYAATRASQGDTSRLGDIGAAHELMRMFFPTVTSISISYFHSSVYVAAYHPVPDDAPKWTFARKTEVSVPGRDDATALALIALEVYAESLEDAGK